MRALEANADYFGVSYAEMMESAGRKAAETIMSRKPRGTVLVVCGTGNNGGDGFVIARYLARAHYGVFVTLLGKADAVKKGPAAVNLERLKAAGVEVIEMSDAKKLTFEMFDSCDIIVDAILGTGFTGPPREPAMTAIKLINASPAWKVSVDVPSGLDAYTGSCEGCVRPDLVVTFHAPKIGLNEFNTQVIDIGIPEKAASYAGPGDLMNIRSRGDFSHKGESGRVLVIGGGPYTGAPALTALAAYRAGADIVTVAAPSRAANIIATFSPDLIVKPMTDPETLVEADIERIKDLIGRHDVVVMGMGAGQDPCTLHTIKGIVSLCDKIVMDADALRHGIPLKGIITPHRGEYRRIGGEDAESVEDRALKVKEFSSKNKVVTLLKGAVDIVSDGDRIKLNGTGNPGMTVGGTGDALAGITAAFHCKNDAFEAACAGAFVSGAAGDLAFHDKGFGLLASDVIGQIPYAIKKYKKQRDK